MFEKAEKVLRDELHNLLNIPIVIGIPDPIWVEKTEPPYGVVYLSSCRPIELISAGVEEERVNNGDGTYTVTFLDGEADMRFTFELASRRKKELDELTLTLLKHFATKTFIGEDSEYVVSEIPSFRDELPGEREERIFIRIFTIALVGPLTHEETLYEVQEVDQDDSFVGYDPV